VDFGHGQTGNREERQRAVVACDPHARRRARRAQP
jgi:hypothetical protein